MAGAEFEAKSVTKVKVELESEFLWIIKAPADSNNKPF